MFYGLSPEDLLKFESGEKEESNLTLSCLAPGLVEIGRKLGGTSLGGNQSSV